MNNTVNFKELRDKLSSDDIIAILEKLDTKCVKDAENYLIFPTACHNLTGGSDKLYYYKDSKMFKCYTQCEGTFDIFELLKKMFQLRGKDINIFDAIKFCGLDASSFVNNEAKNNVQEDVNYMYNLLHTKYDLIDLPRLDKTILYRYVFDFKGLSIWKDEGINYETMFRYGIKYDPIENCIIIPNYDINNNLISIRGRFLNEDADAKYKPIIYGGKVLSHPSSLALYGLNMIKENVKRTKKVIIFEGEKSVMKFDSIYGADKNISVATLGKSISPQQIQLLTQLGVNEIMLAYDRDYTDYITMDKVRKEYIKIAKSLTTYFNVCILMDLDLNLLNYKDSPIDQGQITFEKLLQNRIYV